MTHLPPIIQLGAIRGYVFYPRQPKKCRKCGGNDHLAAECDNVVCKNCRSDEHIAKECPFPRKCNLCGREGHTFRVCPQSYAHRVKKPQLQQLEEVPTVIGNCLQVEEDTSNNQVNELQLEMVMNKTRDSGGGERGEDRSPQVATHEDLMAVSAGMATELMGRGESALEIQNMPLEASVAQVSQIAMDPERHETSQEEMASFPGTPSLILPSTSKECRDLLDFMFPDLATTQPKHIIGLDEEELLLPPCPVEDKVTTPLEPFMQSGFYEVTTSQK